VVLSGSYGYLVLSWRTSRFEMFYTFGLFFVEKCPNCGWIV